MLVDPNGENIVFGPKFGVCVQKGRKDVRMGQITRRGEKFDLKKLKRKKIGPIRSKKCNKKSEYRKNNWSENSDSNGVIK